MLELLEKVGQSAAKFRILLTLWEVPKDVQRLVRNNVGEKLRNGENLKLKFMKYIVYQTINTVNNKIYIGVHGTENPN